jgi:hypothetical protein
LAVTTNCPIAVLKPPNTIGRSHDANDVSRPWIGAVISLKPCPNSFRIERVWSSSEIEWSIIAISLTNASQHANKIIVISLANASQHANKIICNQSIPTLNQGKLLV